MAIELLVEPRKTYSWEEFKQQKPSHSIALDGIVNEGPKDEPSYLNLNHHEEVVRDATMATCLQSYIKVKKGRFKIYGKKDGPTAKVHVNDSDFDVSMAFWMIDNHERFEDTKEEPAINELLYITNELDVMSGTFPKELNSPSMGRYRHVFQPYRDLRTSGELFTADAQTMEKVIRETGTRIHKYSEGDWEELPPDIRHSILYKGNGWTMVREVGVDARQHLFLQGMEAFISLIGIRKDGKHVYSIGRMQESNKLYDALNEAEDISKDCLDRWGGSPDNGGGSPREAASGLTPQEVIKVAERVLN